MGDFDFSNRMVRPIGDGKPADYFHINGPSLIVILGKIAGEVRVVAEYLTAVYPDSTEPDKQALVQRDRSWSEFCFDQGKGNRLAGIAGSLWAGFNGVTEWIDHRKTRQNPNQRLNSAWFGESSRIKARGFSIAMDKVAVWN
jgi:hypothetical protein